jgi:hypothetical protein
MRFAASSFSTIAVASPAGHYASFRFISRSALDARPAGYTASHMISATMPAFRFFTSRIAAADIAYVFIATYRFHSASGRRLLFSALLFSFFRQISDFHADYFRPLLSAISEPDAGVAASMACQMADAIFACSFTAPHAISMAEDTSRRRHTVCLSQARQRHCRAS